MGWLLRLVTGAPLVGGPDKEKRQRGPRPEKVTGGRMVELRHCWGPKEHGAPKLAVGADASSRLRRLRLLARYGCSSVAAACHRDVADGRSVCCQR